MALLRKERMTRILFFWMLLPYRVPVRSLNETLVDESSAQKRCTASGNCSNTSRSWLRRKVNLFTDKSANIEWKHSAHDMIKQSLPKHERGCLGTMIVKTYSDRRQWCRHSHPRRPSERPNGLKQDDTHESKTKNKSFSCTIPEHFAVCGLTKTAGNAVRACSAPAEAFVGSPLETKLGSVCLID